MQEGDLVKFKNCREAGAVGIITVVGHTFNSNVGSCNDVHLVVVGGEEKWFTTNQLEVISANR